MKVYIVGRGAVGSYLGDKLESIGVEVSYAPRALDAVTPYDADVAIVTTKAYDTDGAIVTLRKAIAYPEKCVFVSPQNGVTNEEKLAEAFGANNVVAAALTVPVDRNRDGHASAAKEGGLAFAPVGESAFNWLTATFASSGMRVTVLSDWRALKWSKLALNVVANASCAILNVLPARLVHFEKIFTLEIRMIREVRRSDGRDEDQADRPAALSGPRIARVSVVTESGRAYGDGCEHRRRPRYKAAFAVARSPRGQAAK